MEAWLPLLFFILLVLSLYLEQKLLTIEGWTLLQWFDAQFWRPIVVKDATRPAFYNTKKMQWCSAIRANWVTIWDEYRTSNIHPQPTSEVRPSVLRTLSQGQTEFTRTTFISTIIGWHCSVESHTVAILRSYPPEC